MEMPHAVPEFDRGLYDDIPWSGDASVFRADEVEAGEAVRVLSRKHQDVLTVLTATLKVDSTSTPFFIIFLHHLSFDFIFWSRIIKYVNTVFYHFLSFDFFCWSRIIIVSLIIIICLNLIPCDVFSYHYYKPESDTCKCD